MIIYETNMHKLKKNTHNYSIIIKYIFYYFYIIFYNYILFYLFTYNYLKTIKLLLFSYFRISLHIIISFYLNNHAFDRKRNKKY